MFHKMAEILAIIGGIAGIVLGTIITKLIMRNTITTIGAYIKIWSISVLISLGVIVAILRVPITMLDPGFFEKEEGEMIEYTEKREEEFSYQNREDSSEYYLKPKEEIYSYQEEIKIADEYIFPDSDVRYLTEDELFGFTAELCRIARNEIYARHGRMFNDPVLQEYFNSCSWYYPLIPAEEFDESVFNAFEVVNRDLIVQYEKKQGYQ